MGHGFKLRFSGYAIVFPVFLQERIMLDEQFLEQLFSPTLCGYVRSWADACAGDRRKRGSAVELSGYRRPASQLLDVGRGGVCGAPRA
ncbi:MAG: hypothetical protein ABI778_10345, partial [Ignavibacteriota bacterium]